MQTKNPNPQSQQQNNPEEQAMDPKPQKKNKTYEHCGMPTVAEEDAARAYCYGCHDWHPVEKLKAWKEPTPAKKAQE